MNRNHVEALHANDFYLSDSAGAYRPAILNCRYRSTTLREFALTTLVSSWFEIL
jgi:hypothetical protein